MPPGDGTTRYRRRQHRSQPLPVRRTQASPPGRRPPGRVAVGTDSPLDVPAAREWAGRTKRQSRLSITEPDAGARAHARRTAGRAGIGAGIRSGGRACEPGGSGARPARAVASSRGRARIRESAGEPVARSCRVGPHGARLATPHGRTCSRTGRPVARLGNPNDTGVRIRVRRPYPVCALRPSLVSGL